MSSAQNIHVIVRIRPLNKPEKKRKTKRCTKVLQSGQPRDLDISPNRLNGGALVQVELPPSTSSRGGGQHLPSLVGGAAAAASHNPSHTAVKQYRPACALPPSSSQQDAFLTSNLPSLIKHSMNGYRTTFFAYGQTGAGKSYTVLGEDKKPGLLYRTANFLYKATQAKAESDNMKFTVRLSAIELYNEQCFDLLTTGHARLKPLQVREHDKQGFYVDRLTGVRCVR